MEMPLKDARIRYSESFVYRGLETKCSEESK